MYESDPRKSNAQKLAETLKRCGLASSVTQAHQMAGDITSTEKKVQTFFDQKKKEMKDELMMSIHGNREEFKNIRSNDIVSAQIESFRNENSKSSEESIVQVQPTSQPIKIQIEVETKTQNQNVCQECKSQIETPKPEQAVEVKILQPETIENIETVIKESDQIGEPKTETAQNDDYINQFIAKPEEKVTDNMPKTEPAVEKEEIKEPETLKVNTYTLPPQRPQVPQAMGPHPKTGQSNGVDINNFFNFQKKGKV